MQIGKAIKRAITAHGWTAKELAENSDLSTSTITRWINGKSSPETASLIAVEQALGLTPGELLRIGGYLPECPQTTRDAIATDPNLTEVGRRAVLATYDALVNS